MRIMAGMEQHTHDHAHDHRHGPAPRAAGFSLLRLSALQRLGIVAVALVLLWGGVHWALS
ncbi:hypothetical protein [Rhodoblastus sp.]|uniref:hypothetical protein n=2 Tax=Rhodoblastus sp. TaxID=1962975 RepID=UPI003F951E92